MIRFITQAPVLFLLFNRLDLTKRVFETIRNVKPPRLYIAADGPRENRIEDVEKCQSVREYVMHNVDWTCELKTLFREKNLGCGKAVSEAITWFFENEEMGIILEDDCLPSQSFFRFCEELLHRYKNDMRVWHIGGYNYPYLNGDEYSYNFTRFTYVWGWASWADRWKNYDKNLALLREKRDLLLEYEFFGEDCQNRVRNKILKEVLQGNIDTWDYQWNFAIRTNNGLSIRPKVNLVENIGFGQDETHPGDGKNFPVNYANDIEFPLKHPDFIMIHKKDDSKFAERIMMKSYFAKIKKRIFGDV